MIKFQKISGVNLVEDSQLPRLSLTPEGRAMGAIPGWSVFYDPDYANLDEQWIRNRARPNSKGFTTYSETDTVNGQLYWDSRDSGIRAVFEGDLDPERWSLFWVLADTRDTGIPRRLCISEGQQTEQIAVNVALGSSSDRIIIYENSNRSSGQPIRLTTGQIPNALANNPDPGLAMATFSIENGLSIYWNGELVAREEDDKRPLEYGYKAGEYAHRIVTCLTGMMGALNIDLGAPENTGHRRAIERFLMDKYGIPQGPQ